MKSLEELRAIRAKMQGKVGVRAENEEQIRGRCGNGDLRDRQRGEACPYRFIRRGAGTRYLRVICVTQTGCIGLCQYEPIVEVMEPGKEKVTYVKMTPEKALEVLRMHLLGGKVVTKYTLSAVQDGLK